MRDISKERLPTTTRHRHKTGIEHDLKVKSSVLKPLLDHDSEFAKEKVKVSRYSAKQALVLALAAFSFYIIALHQSTFTTKLNYKLSNVKRYINKHAFNINAKPRRKVSAVILTYTKHEKFSVLLDSVLKQKQDNFELIIADSGCLPETQKVIKNAFRQKKNQWLSKSHKYIQLCHNPGYAIGNNEAVKLADPSSEWVLLLNDDIIMQGESFITDMLRLG